MGAAVGDRLTGAAEAGVIGLGMGVLVGATLCTKAKMLVMTDKVYNLGCLK